MATIKRTFVSDLHLACAKDELRPAMECVHFKNGYAYASDSHMLIKQSLLLSDTIEGLDILDGKAIHKDSFKEIRKYHNVEATEDGFDCTAKDGRKAFFPFSKFDDGVKIPDFDAVLPKGGITHLGEIGVNPKYVGILEKAMAGGNLLRMAFTGVNTAIVFESMASEYEDQIAIVMPQLIA